MTKTKNNSMKTSSKIIISVLSILVLLLGVGWAYTEGYVTGLFSGSDDLEAKKSNYPNYIERFSFNGIDFVQNVALAVPTPETVKTYAHLDGTLTLKHNESKSKVLYVDTPARVSLSSDDATFYYTADDLVDENNATFTRHKFYLLPNVEYDFTYKILNVNEFIDHSGEVSFTLRDSDLSDSKEVKTEFMSPLSDYSEIKLGEYFNNDFDKYFKKDLNETINVKVKDRVSGGTILSVEGMFKLIDYQTYIRVYYFPAVSSGKIVYFNHNVEGDLDITVKDNSLFINDVLIFDDVVNSLSDSRTVRAGGIETQQDVSFSNYNWAGYTYHYIRTGYATGLCPLMGFDTHVSSTQGAYRSGGDLYRVNNNIYYKWTTNDESDQAVVCRYTARVDSRNLELKSSLMEYPYLVDESKEISLPMNATEIKIDLGDSIKTLNSVYENNVTKFTIPAEFSLVELEEFDLILDVDGEGKAIPVYYDPSRSQKALWSIFDSKLEELEG